MLLQFLVRYYKIFWLAFVAIALLKIILSYSFNEKLRGLLGGLYALFKWYNLEEQEMEDLEPRRVIMRFHNIITLFMYLFGIFLIFLTLLYRLLPH